MLVTTEAIVLRTRKQGDTSLICSLYTREFGIVTVIAKGARQMRSPLAGALDLFTRITAVFYKKQGKELYLLGKAEIKKRSGDLQSSLEKIEAASKICETLLTTLHDEEENLPLFSLLQNALDSVADSRDASSVYCALITFYQSYAELNGFRLQLPEEVGFDVRYACNIGSGVIAEHYGADEEDRFVPLSGECVAVLRHLHGGSQARLRVSDRAVHSLEYMFGRYYTAHFDGMHKQRSAGVFAQMNKN